MSSYTGISPKDPNKYLGPSVYLSSIVSRNREPTGADYRQPETGKIYPMGSLWIISKNPTTGSQGALWYLSKIVANVAYWIELNSGGNAAIETLTGDSGGPIAGNASNNINIKSDANFTGLGGTGIITGASNQLTLNLTLALASPQPIGTTTPSTARFTGLGVGVTPPVTGIELASGNGVKYDTSAGGSGTTPTSNTQLIYEEGTFVPTLVGGTIPGVTTYTLQVGRYVRIGNWVWINYTIDITAATGTGNANFIMPFTAQSSGIESQSLGGKQDVGTGVYNIMSSSISPGTNIGHLRAEGSTTVYQMENAARFYSGGLFYRIA